MSGAMETVRALRAVHANFTAARVSPDDLRSILDTCVRAANASGTATRSGGFARSARG